MEKVLRYACRFRTFLTTRNEYNSCIVVVVVIHLFLFVPVVNGRPDNEKKVGPSRFLIRKRRDQTHYRDRHTNTRPSFRIGSVYNVKCTKRDKYFETSHGFYRTVLIFVWTFNQPNRRRIIRRAGHVFNTWRGTRSRDRRGQQSKAAQRRDVNESSLCNVVYSHRPRARAHAYVTADRLTWTVVGGGGSGPYNLTLGRHSGARARFDDDGASVDVHVIRNRNRRGCVNARARYETSKPLPPLADKPVNRKWSPRPHEFSGAIHIRRVCVRARVWIRWRWTVL